MQNARYSGEAIRVAGWLCIKCEKLVLINVDGEFYCERCKWREWPTFDDRLLQVCTLRAVNGRIGDEEGV